MTKKRVEAKIAKVFEAFEPESGPGWRHRKGQRVYLGQRTNGSWYIEIRKYRIERYVPWNPREKPDEDGFVQKERKLQGGVIIKVEDSDVEGLFDALVTLREAMKSGKSLAEYLNGE